MIGAPGLFRRLRGLTLIELMVVLAVAGTILFVAAPSLRDMILVQRLRATTNELITDLQFARAEAAARNEFVRFRFQQNSTLSCYVIFTADDNAKRCDCRNGPGAACSDAGTREVKTVSILKSSGVSLSIPAGQVSLFAFDHVTGGIWAIPADLGSYMLPGYRLDVSISGSRRLAASVIQSGRVARCAPAGSTMNEVAC